MLRLAILSFSFLSLASCEDWRNSVIRDRMLRQHSALQNYRGQFQEKRIFRGGDLNYEVSFQKPDKFFSKITTPGDLAGAYHCINGGRQAIYYPSTNFGLRLENMPPILPEESERVLRDTFDWYMAKYNARLLGGGMIAGVNTNRIRYTPRQPGYPPIETDFFDTYAFPLRITIGDPEQKLFYEASYQAVEFNTTLDESLFDCRVPGRSTLSDWDYASRDYSLSEMHSNADFRVNAPALDDMPLTRIIRVKGPVTAFMLAYHARPYWLYVFVSHNYGNQLTPPGRGIRIGKEGSIWLNFAGLHISASTTWKGANYTLVSNQKYDRVIEIADSLLK